MRGGHILFIVEGKSDKDALIPYITDQVMENKIQTTVKVVGGDITSRWIKNCRNIFECNPDNIKEKIEELITEYLKSKYAKNDFVTSKTVNKVYYITDTDNCFFEETSNRINKRECLKEMFNFPSIKISKTKDVPIEILFLAKDLETVTINNTDVLTADEKTALAVEFTLRAQNEAGYFNNVFRREELKTWGTYAESYDGIPTYSGTASNINNLLDEIEEWKNN